MTEVTRLISSEHKPGYYFDADWGVWEEGDDLLRERIKRLMASVTVPAQYAEFQPPPE